MPPGLPSHDTNTVAVGGAARRPRLVGRALDRADRRPGHALVRRRHHPDVRRSCPRSGTPGRRRTSCRRRRWRPPDRRRTCRSLFGIETFLLQVMPPSVVNENAHTRVDALVHPAGDREPVRAGRERDLGLTAAAGVVVEADVRRPGRGRQRRPAADARGARAGCRPRAGPAARVRPSRLPCRLRPRPPIHAPPLPPLPPLPPPRPALPAVPPAPPRPAAPPPAPVPAAPVVPAAPRSRGPARPCGAGRARATRGSGRTGRTRRNVAACACRARGGARAGSAGRPGGARRRPAVPARPPALVPPAPVPPWSTSPAHDQETTALRSSALRNLAVR